MYRPYELVDKDGVLWPRSILRTHVVKVIRIEKYRDPTSSVWETYKIIEIIKEKNQQLELF